MRVPILKNFWFPPRYSLVPNKRGDGAEVISGTNHPRGAKQGLKLAFGRGKKI